MASNNKFTITLDKFYQGYGPTYWKNSLSSFGNAGNASAMTDIDILTPEYLTQGLGKAILTAGDQTGAITELTTFILDQPTADGVTYGIGATKLQKLSNTAVTNAGGWPHTITNATGGNSLAYLKGYLFYFYNKSSGADCGRFDLSSTFDDDYMSTVPIGAGALVSAPHPVATKEDLMLFGNGRYVGVYTSSADTLESTKLDFGNNYQVADIIFHNNNWYIAVNSSIASDSNRGIGHIYLYDGSALSSLLKDEVNIGLQKIGFMQVVNGIIYVAYQDLSSAGYKLGYLSGNQIKPLVAFTSSLPTYAQKTLYNGVLALVAGNKVWLAGSIDENLPFALSQIATPTLATAGALACPFGNLLMSSTTTTSFKLEKFSGYSVTGTWTSLVMDLAKDGNLAYLDKLIVYTESFSAGGSVAITCQYNDNSSNSGAKTVSAASARRHEFTLGSNNIENVRVYLTYAAGSATIPVKIKKIEILGHTLER